MLLCAVLSGLPCRKAGQVYGIRDAYRGLVEGGAHLFPLDTGSVGASFREGGTFLGSARFTDIVGSSQQAQNLKLAALSTLGEAGISGLVVIGGDGSSDRSTGAVCFSANTAPAASGNNP